MAQICTQNSICACEVHWPSFDVDRACRVFGMGLGAVTHQQNVTFLVGVLLSTYPTRHFLQGCTSHLQVKSPQVWQVRPISYSALQLSFCIQKPFTILFVLFLYVFLCFLFLFFACCHSAFQGGQKGCILQVEVQNTKYK